MKRNRFLSYFFSMALIAGLCLGIGMLAWGIWNVPTWAEAKFGKAAGDKGSVQQIILSIKLLSQANDLISAVEPNGSNKDFRVDMGETPVEIGNKLQDSGLISNSNAFIDYLVYSGLDATIQAGNYRLSPRMNAIEIANALQDATPSEVEFNLLPGWRLEEIALTLPTSGLSITPEDFLSAAGSTPNHATLQGELPQGATLEGFLSPDLYIIQRNINVQMFLELLVDNFLSKITNDLREGFTRQNLNLFEAVTLASIVEREAVVDEEMPMIASVYLNRLRTEMKLDADPTVQYAVGYNPTQNTWWTNPISQSDLQINSPFNTYINWGLPPGPIANPGLLALQAVAYPAQTPYFFFRAACDGSGRHVFAETFEQHVANACP